MRRLVGAVAVLALGPLTFALASGQPSSGGGSVDVARGRALYAQKCAVCHGAEGRGDGPAEFVLFPKPRDLTSGIFKVRSTSTLPTDDDLMRVIGQGLPGTAMPGWAGALTVAERRDLVAFVKTLSPVFRERPPGRPLVVPPAPKPTAALLALGKKFYVEAECFKCHGPGGRGDGESADTLKDDWGHPIVPYDFTIPGRMKAGGTVSDVFRTLKNGIGGTPMPAYGDALGDEETWGLAYYVTSLAGKAPAARPVAETGAVRVRRVAGAVPADPDAAAWRRAARQAVPLRTLWLRAEQVAEVRVAALHDGKTIGILLEWDDPVADQAALSVDEFRDAAAVQFPAGATALHGHAHAEPSYVMGERGRTVNIWHWKADWQRDLARFRDAHDRHPALVVDDFPFVSGVRSSDAAAVRADAAQHDPLFLTGRAAGNPMSQPRRSAVESLIAEGIGTITSQPPAAQVVAGQGRWAEGRWRVVMVRALRTPSAGDAQFAPGESSAVAFAVWDGARGDRDGQKAVSLWQTLRLDR